MNNHLPLISVIVATYNRPAKIIQLIHSLSHSSLKNFELIIIDQSDTANNSNAIKKFSSIITTLIYKHTPKNVGKSRALNLGISLSRAPILAFTDDDCIVDKNWLKSIRDEFCLQADLVGIFGQIKPFQPNKHINMKCPSTFERKRRFRTKKICIHWKKLGYGANMAFKKNAVIASGGFNTLFGPGSIGKAAEDANLCLKILKQNMLVTYSPAIIVFHNNWMSKKEYLKLHKQYTWGGIFCYMPYILRSKKILKMVLSSIHFLLTCK